jgi:hypothetical protein
MRMRRFEAQGLQGQESQPEPKDIKKRSALRWLSLAGVHDDPRLPADRDPMIALRELALH